jgi:hypothetical protein
MKDDPVVLNRVLRNVDVLPRIAPEHRVAASGDEAPASIGKRSRRLQHGTCAKNPRGKREHPRPSVHSRNHIIISRLLPSIRAECDMSQRDG